jgi:hypothetical protein
MLAEALPFCLKAIQTKHVDGHVCLLAAQGNEGHRLLWIAMISCGENGVRNKEGGKPRLHPLFKSILSATVFLDHRVQTSLLPLNI